jgi:hypothetical protein
MGAIIMGKSYEISCVCGYKKKLNIGGGLASCNINTVNRVFSEEKLREFNEYYNNNEVVSFLVENELSQCNKCREVMTVAVLRVKLTNNRNLIIINDCPKCNGNLQILNELPMCPKCGEKMTEKEIGDWD